MKYFLDGLFFGRIDKSAGINNNNVREVATVDQLQAAMDKEATHDFRINQILRTP
jgi:hypothetical protein